MGALNRIEVSYKSRGPPPQITTIRNVCCPEGVAAVHRSQRLKKQAFDTSRPLYILPLGNPTAEKCGSECSEFVLYLYWPWPALFC